MVELAALALDPDRERRASVFPALRSGAHFNAAAVSPLPAPTADAMRAAITAMEQRGSAAWFELDRKVRAARSSIAHLFGVSAARVAFRKNTTEGIGTIAQGFPWRDGDSVVFPADDFPVNVFPWRALAARGVELRPLRRGPGQPLSAEAILAAVDGTTRIVALSLAAYDDGFRYPLEAVAEGLAGRDVYLVVDAAQGLGAMPLEVARFDAVVAGAHKWLLGPEGTGILILSDRLLERLEVREIGWHNIVQPPASFQSERLELVPGARRFEGGTYAVAGLIGLGASIDLIAAVGIARIWERVESLTAHLRQALSAAGHRVVSPNSPGQRSGIVSFAAHAPIEPIPLARQLAERDVLVSARGGRLRAAPHFFVDESDVERLLAALAG